MSLSGQQVKVVVDTIVDITKDGPITGWTERIAQLCKRIGLPVERIDWAGSPIQVALHVVQVSESCGYMGILMYFLKLNF